MTSVSPDGNELAATSNSGLQAQPLAGQLIGVLSAMNPVMVIIAPMITKANPKVRNVCLQGGAGFIPVRPIKLAYSKWFKFAC